jgi:hypothetical protein
VRLRSETSKVRLRFKGTLIEIIEADKLLLGSDRTGGLFSLGGRTELKTQKATTGRHRNVDDGDGGVVVREEEEVEVILEKEKKLEVEEEEKVKD